MQGLDKISDKADFTAKIFPDKVVLTDIKNYQPTVQLRNPPQCKTKVSIDKTCVGIIDIMEANLVKFSVSKNNPPKIVLQFREKQNLLYKLQYICKKISSPVTDITGYSAPDDIKFLANGQSQTYYDDVTSVQIIITPGEKTK
jgi:hypothetical protein